MATNELALDWANLASFSSLHNRPQLTDGSARCTRLLLCDDAGIPATRFEHGQRAHFLFEFEVLRDIEVPAGGVELAGVDGVVVHGKNTFQTGSAVPRQVTRGSILRFQEWIELRLAPGTYHVSIGLAQCDAESYEGYVQGRLSSAAFASKARECCRLVRVARIEVRLDGTGRLPHYGVAELPGNATAQLLQGTSAPRAVADPAKPDWPTILHITHWKAGSQWIYKVLRQCAPERIVPPEVGEAQIRYYPIQPGHIYPTVYMSKDELDRVAMPAGTKRFVVIRDLRDTLVSAYFNFKISHSVIDQANAVVRETLQVLSMEDGMLSLMGDFLEKCAHIQLSWLESGDLVLRYTDLLHNDLELLENALIEHCRLPISRDVLREAILANRFEVLTGGRARGQEDRSAHERKGISGDWKNYFTDRLKKAFKARYGGLLAAAGYERNLDW